MSWLYCVYLCNILIGWRWGIFSHFPTIYADHGILQCIFQFKSVMYHVWINISWTKFFSHCFFLCSKVLLLPWQLPLSLNDIYIPHFLPHVQTISWNLCTVLILRVFFFQFWFYIFRVTLVSISHGMLHIISEEPTYTYIFFWSPINHSTMFDNLLHD